MTDASKQQGAILPEASAGTSEWTDASAADARALRDLFGAYLTGVTVVTLKEPDGTLRGFTANSFTSVSLDPPLILVCIANQARSHDALCAAGRFGICILGDWQREASDAFSGRTGKKFEAVDIRMTSAGTPLITGSLAAMECEMEKVVPAGDHSIVIGRVVGFRKLQGQPLGYHSGGYVALGLGAEALERFGGDAIRIGCLLESRDKVLLLRRSGSSHWELPAAALRAGEDHRKLLPRLLSRLGIQADVSFLYSVYQDPGDAHTTMIFRGTTPDVPDRLELQDGVRLELFGRDAEPWQLVQGRSPAEIIRRFFRERARSRFGIYWDTGDGGRIASLQSDPARWQRSTETDEPNPIEG